MGNLTVTRRHFAYLCDSVVLVNGGEWNKTLSASFVSNGLSHCGILWASSSIKNFFFFLPLPSSSLVELVTHMRQSHNALSCMIRRILTSFIGHLLEHITSCMGRAHVLTAMLQIFWWIEMVFSPEIMWIKCLLIHHIVFLLVFVMWKVVLCSISQSVHPLLDYGYVILQWGARIFQLKKFAYA